MKREVHINNLNMFAILPRSIEKLWCQVTTMMIEDLLNIIYIRANDQKKKNLFWRGS